MTFLSQPFKVLFRFSRESSIILHVIVSHLVQ